MNRTIAFTLLVVFTLVGVNGAAMFTGRSEGGGAMALAGPLANKTIEAKLNFSLPLPCVVINWHFIITDVQDPSQAPSSITVYWSTGGSQQVPLDRVTGQTAQYNVAPPSGSAYPTRVTASIYDSWAGTFTYSHLNCEATPTPTVTNTPVATNTPTVTATPTETQVPTATPTATQVPNTATPTATQAANTATPTATQAANTATPTATQAANTATPTATQAANTATPTATVGAANTATATPTQPASTATPQPTATQPASTATPVPTAVGGVAITPTPTATTRPADTATPVPTAVAGVAIAPTPTSGGEEVVVHQEADVEVAVEEVLVVAEAETPATQPTPTALPKAGDAPLDLGLLALVGLAFVTLGIGMRRLVR